MSVFTFAALGIEFVPSAALVGIASIVLFAIVGVLVGPEYENMNTTAKDNINRKKL